MLRDEAGTYTPDSTTTAPPTLPHLIDRYAHLTVDAAAERLLAEAPRLILLALCRHAVVNHRRSTTRALERAVDEGPDATEEAPRTPRRRHAARMAAAAATKPARPTLTAGERRHRADYARLLLRPLAIGHRRSVTYGEATVQDLNDRIEYLRSQVTGISLTIARIERLRDALAASGLTRLADLPADRLLAMSHPEDMEA